MRGFALQRRFSAFVLLSGSDSSKISLPTMFLRREQPSHAAGFISNCLEPAPESPARSLDEKMIVLEVLRRTSATGAALVLNKDGEFVCVASVGPCAPPQGTIVDTTNGLSGLSIRTCSILNCEDALSDARVNQDACRTLETRSIVIVPILCKETAVGLIEILAREPKAFDEASINTVREHAAYVAACLHRVEVPVNENTAEASSQGAADVAVESVNHGPSHTAEDAPRGRNRTARSVSVAVALLLIAMSLPLAIHWYKRQTHTPQRTASEQDPGTYAERASDPTGELPFKQARRDLSRNDNAAYEHALALERDGRPQDLVEAYAWYVVAANHGNQQSDDRIRTLTPQMPQGSIAEVRLRVGQIYERGERVQPDLETAFFWYSLASELGNPQAAVQKERVAKLLKDEERQRAEERATRWLKAHSARTPQMANAVSSSR